MSSQERWLGMLDRLNDQFRDVSINDWKLIVSLLIVANSVSVAGLGWLVINRMAPRPPSLEARVMAQMPPTRTPLPTFTSTPLPPSPTNTRVPTWTPTPTSTPTITPTPTDTPTNTPQPTVIQRPAATPTPAPTPTPSVDFVVSVRQLTACENEGKHHLFIYVKDINGQGMSGARVRVSWAGGEATMMTGEKMHIDPGFVDFAMFKGTYTVEVLDYTTEIAGPITPDIPRNELCAETGNDVANSLFHYSYEVIFQKVR